MLVTIFCLYISHFPCVFKSGCLSIFQVSPGILNRKGMLALSETYVMRFHSLAKQNLTHFSEAGVLSNHSYRVFNRNATKSARKKYRAKTYRREWEKESWARNWLCMSKNGVSKAYCKVCDKDLAPGSQN